MISIVIGAVGTITESTNTNLKRLGLTKQRDVMQMTVMKGSVNILNAHLKPTEDRPARKKRKAVGYHIHKQANR